MGSASSASGAEKEPVWLEPQTVKEGDASESRVGRELKF